MRLESRSFTHGERIPARHTCEGDDLSPELRWRDVPQEARSLALFVDDPDAPNGTFTHWIVYDIDPGLGELPERAQEVGRSGRNDFQHAGWGGPCPPPGHGDHRYRFRLYALDVPTLELESGAPREDVEKRMEGHVIAEAELMGRYARRAN